MRIIAGTWRGRPIESPKGTETRPTTDRVREALMSSLYSLRGDFDDAVVLDAFAGSGALGIEALSRGAACAVFCDVDKRAVQTVKKNLSSLGADTMRAQVLARDVLRTAPPRAAQPFDLVFLDPPYATDPTDVLGQVASWMGEGIVSADALVVYEHALGNAPSHPSFEALSSRRYGKTGVTMLTRKVQDCLEGDEGGEVV